MARHRLVAIVGAAAFACGWPDLIISQVLQHPASLATSAQARSGSRDNERLREMQERAAEQARQQAEQQAEQAKRQAEQQAEQAKRLADSIKQRFDNSSSGDKAAASQSGRSDSSDNAEKPGKGESASRKPERRNDSNDKDSNDAPPSTIVEWLNRYNPLPKPQQPAKPAEPSVAASGKPSRGPESGHGKPALTPASAPIQPTQADRRKPPAVTPQRGPLTSLPLQSAATEVLALNPSAAAIAYAKKLGFQVQQSANLSQLNMAVMRLTPPAGMDATTARSVLDGQASGTFAVNQVYRPYRAAAAEGNTAAPERIAPRPATTGGCAPDRCYGGNAIRWKEETRSCTQGVRIGIVDTTVDQHHPALKDGFKSDKIRARAFVGDGQREAASSHGTSILSLLAGAPHSGTPGLAPGARFLVADIFHADASGQPLADSMSLLRALDWMDQEGVKIVNMSVAGPPDELMEKAIDRLSKKGVIFVAAAGNEGPAAPPVYPAAYSNVIAITAVARDLRGYRRANRGEYIDAAAPGVDVWAAVPEAKESYQSGTSFAVPFATAVLASVYGQVKVKSKQAMLSALEYTDLGLPGPDPVYGRGLMLAPADCSSALSAVAHAPNSPTAVSLPPPAGVGASSITFGYAAGKP